MADVKEKYEAIALRLGRVFTPTSPIKSDKLFQGRKDQVRQVIDAINQLGQHAILYGERGVGKTSLGYSLKTKLKSLESTPIIAPMVSCDSADDFQSIWTKVFEELAPYETEAEDDGIRRMFEFTPNSVRKRLEPIAEDGIAYVIIDEFDKVIDDRTRGLISDTIKLFSDRSVDATIIIIGVADDVTGLIEEHQSIERCLAQIPMQRMPRKELEEIVLRGLQDRDIGMDIEADALCEITGLSKGLPCYTHLLALHTARTALDDKRKTVTTRDVQNAIDVAIRSTQHESIRADYDKATYSPRLGTRYREVLLACAIAHSDEFGRFQPTDLCDPLNEIVKGTKPFTTDRFAGHLKAFCGDDRGAILERIGSEYRWRYRFSNPLMQPYVIMRGLSTKLISEEKLKSLIQRDEQYPLFAQARKNP